MEPSDISSDPTVQQVLRDLLARASAAEARASAAETRVVSAETRAADAEAKALETEALNTELSIKVAAQDKLIGVLMKRVTSLTRRLATARSRPEQLALEFELRAVQRQLDELNREKFGSKSERRGRKGDKPKKVKKPQTGHGPTPQPDLPRLPQLHLLDEADRVCPNCDPPRLMKPWGDRTADSEEVTVVERTFQITVHQQQVYRCDDCGHIETALGPRRLIPGGRYSPEFGVTVAIDKYMNDQPLASQVREMGNQGLVVTTQTLWDQLCSLYVLLLPAWLMLQKQVLDSDVIYVDETSWRLMKEGGSKRWWVWVATDGRRVFFLLAPTRGQAGARELLRDYDGIVMADRYAVYEALEKARTRDGGRQALLVLDGDTERLEYVPDYLLAACWMHGRRGFVKAERHGDVAAGTALDFIAELYAIEAEAKARVEGIEDREERYQALLEVRRDLRKEKSEPVLERFRAWLDAVVTIPGLPLDDAVRWVRNGWTQLTRFASDPRIPLDNGLSERVIRGVVKGRKVYAGSRSEHGCMVAALFYSLVQSCRLEGVDPRAYMLEAVHRALKDRDDVLLPEDYAALIAAGQETTEDS